MHTLHMQNRGKLLWRHGLSKEKALHIFTGHYTQTLHLLAIFYTLGNHTHIQSMGNTDNIIQKANVVGLGCLLMDKGSIQLEHIQGQLAEQREGGGAGAKIV